MNSKNQWLLVNSKKIFLKDPINDSRIHDGDILRDARDEQRIAGQDRGLREELGGIQLTIFPMMNRGGAPFGPGPNNCPGIQREKTR